MSTHPDNDRLSPGSADQTVGNTDQSVDLEAISQSPNVPFLTQGPKREGECLPEETATYPIFDRSGSVARVIEATQELSVLEQLQEEDRDSVSDERQPDGGGAPFFGMISNDLGMKSIFQLLRQVSSSNAAVLIYGETGTGKQLIAEAIHQNSTRPNGPFITVDCGSLSETLLESELFGHVKGSFTGAIQNKTGLFEEAQGGTLFLDEIGDASLPLQAKLLRLLQEGEARPVGGTRSIKVDVRVVAATNKPLSDAITRKTFREDLYYRVAVIPIAIPPLRERPEDIPLLARHFVARYAAQNRKGSMRLSDEAMLLLLRWSWPGNVRELKNVIERAALISSPPEILPDSIFMKEGTDSMGITPFVSPSSKMGEALAKVEREQILEALRLHKGNKSLFARSLGISRASLYHKLRQYQISTPIQLP